MRLPNTDIMFVLDTTGSMGDRAESTDTMDKMESLKKRVKCFYEIVARLNTDATCVDGQPGYQGHRQPGRRSASASVPYATNVNVG